VLIELHLLQSFPVSNLNRDDVGQPKTATFGGCTRGRISSQCLKRSARQLFSAYGLDPTETGVRTKRLLTAAAKLLAEHGRDLEEAQAVAYAGLEALGFGIDAKTLRTQYLLFVGQRAVALLADFCDRDWERLHSAAQAKQAVATRKKADKAAADEADAEPAEKAKKIKPDKETLVEARRILDADRVADVALFGRMIADNTDFNVDAASQVAHAISTHAVANEFDYYTAVDDLKTDETDHGADMIGTVDFNAACYYRYANLDLDQLTRNLGGDADLVFRSARAWLSAFIHAVPSGKQSSMAARTMPETLLAVTRERGAWNLANAFLRPVTGHDLMAVSTDRLVDHYERLHRFYGGTDIHSTTAASVTGQLNTIVIGEVVTNIEDFTDRVLSATAA
jgi:CRISPR system Cascade subunit CasC